MIGTFSKTIDSNIVEALGYAGFDFIIFDQEHGSVNLTTIMNHVRSAKLSGMKSIVRVPTNSSHLIGAALDTGADGVQIPNISNYKEAKKAIESARFHPNGNRGVCRFVKSANFGTKDKSEYFTSENKKLLILQIEGEKGIDNIDRILELEHFDILFIGPYDLSQSVGLPGEINSEKVTKLIHEIQIKAKSSDKKLGVFVDDKKSLKKYKSKGFDYIAYSVDINILIENTNDIIQVGNGE